MRVATPHKHPLSRSSLGPEVASSGPRLEADESGRLIVPLTSPKPRLCEPLGTVMVYNMMRSILIYAMLMTVKGRPE